MHGPHYTLHNLGILHEFYLKSYLYRRPIQPIVYKMKDDDEYTFESYMNPNNHRKKYEQAGVLSYSLFVEKKDEFIAPRYKNISISFKRPNEPTPPPEDQSNDKRPRLMPLLPTLYPDAVASSIQISQEELQHRQKIEQQKLEELQEQQRQRQQEVQKEQAEQQRKLAERQLKEQEARQRKQEDLLKFLRKKTFVNVDNPMTTPQAQEENGPIPIQVDDNNSVGGDVQMNESFISPTPAMDVDVTQNTEYRDYVHKLNSGNKQGFLPNGIDPNMVTGFSTFEGFQNYLINHPLWKIELFLAQWLLAYPWGQDTKRVLTGEELRGYGYEQEMQRFIDKCLQDGIIKSSFRKDMTDEYLLPKITVPRDHEDKVHLDEYQWRELDHITAESSKFVLRGNIVKIPRVGVKVSAKTGDKSFYYLLYVNANDRRLIAYQLQLEHIEKVSDTFKGVDNVVMTFEDALEQFDQNIAQTVKSYFEIANKTRPKDSPRISDYLAEIKSTNPNLETTTINNHIYLN